MKCQHIDLRDGVPNLDCLDWATLNAFAQGTEDARKAAYALFGPAYGRVGLVRATKGLNAYAKAKIAAMRYRETGYIQEAMDTVRVCDRIYDDLPAIARW